MRSGYPKTHAWQPFHKNALFVYILSFISKEQMDYIRSRIAGKSIEESIHNISNFLNHFEWIEKKKEYHK